MATDPKRLAVVRALLGRRGLDGFLVPQADEHQGEYVPPRARRLAWLTGFSGSAGVAVVLTERAFIFVDGRYTLQVGEQVDTAIFEPLHLIDTPPDGWLATHLPVGARLGYDPWLHTVDDVRHLEAACRRAGGELVPCDGNPIDACWEDQPEPPLAPVIPHPEQYAGKASAEKRAELGAALAEQRLDAVVLTDPASIAWLLNVRGGDVRYNPMPLSFAIVHADGGVDWCVDRRKVGAETRSHVGDAIRAHSPAALGGLLDDLGSAGRRVAYDGATGNAWIRTRLIDGGAEVVPGADPCAGPRARKNPVELAGAAAVHRRDGAALTRFLAWIDAEGPLGGQTELSAAAALERFRSADPGYRGPSFETISAAAAHGAIIHYAATEESSAPIGPGMLYLIDAGGQYVDGTTDVTRTVVIGEPTAEQKGHFTRVLKGHIALATCRFPEGTTGHQLDVLARQPLWEAGLDYDHGTGHGVGSYLCVHEGPQRISKRPSKAPLERGMVLSNEPGYYRAGAYGIRTENLVVVVPSPAVPGAEKPLSAFETLTLAPIDRRLVDRSLLTPPEAGWLDAYHARVREELTPLLDEATAAWLEQATAPI